MPAFGLLGKWQSKEDEGYRTGWAQGVLQLAKGFAKFERNSGVLNVLMPPLCAL